MLYFLLFMASMMASASESWFVGRLEIILAESPKKGLVNPSCLSRGRREKKIHSGTMSVPRWYICFS